MAYDPNRVHSDVASCLDEIARAVKGEEVRGSIYDAIELIDARSAQLETDIRNQAEEFIEEDSEGIIHGFIGNLCVIFDLDISIPSRNAPTILSEIANGRTIISNVKYDGSYRYGMTCTTYIAEYILHIVAFAPSSNGAYIEIFNIEMPVSVTNPMISNYTRTLVPISGGGGSCTEGDGIDINNDEISVKLRSSNPGLAFTNDGELYATGSGGSYSGSGCISVYNNVISLSYGDGLTVEYNSLNDIYELVPDYTYVQQKLDAGYGIAIRPGTGASTNPEISVLPGVFMPYYDINQGSGLIIVANANDSTSLEVDFTTVQSKLTAGTGISIQNGVISLDLPQAEGGGF